MIDQTTLTNEKAKAYDFLDCMYEDDYFPNFLVDKCKYVLLELCIKIEVDRPADLSEFYTLSHAATRKINDLEGEFFDNDSEIETIARECLAMNFAYIAETYGYEADLEEMIAPRDW